MYLDNVIDNILKGLGKQVSVMMCNILDLVISVSFIYFLLPVFSTNGYIIVLYISEILNYTISVMTLFRTTDLKFKFFNWVIFPVISMAISILLTKSLLFRFSNVIIDLIVKIIISLLTYLSIIYIKNRYNKKYQK